MSARKYRAASIQSHGLAISVKANFGIAKVMPELKQAKLLRGMKV